MRNQSNKQVTNLRLFTFGIAVLLLVAIGIAGFFTLIAHRHTQAKEIAEANTIVRDIASRLRYEALRTARLELDKLVDAVTDTGAYGRKLSPQEVDAVAEKLTAAGFVIDVRSLGKTRTVSTGLPQTPGREPNRLLQSLEKVRYFAALEGDTYLFILPWYDKVKIAKALGGVSPTNVLAAVQLSQPDLLHAARGVLLPGTDISFYVDAMPAVSLVRSTGQRLNITSAPSPLPDSVLMAPEHTVDLSSPAEWPKFLLFGGHEVAGLFHQDETRRGTDHHAIYLREPPEEGKGWQGLVVAYPNEGNATTKPWSAAQVGIALLLYVVLAVLVFWRLGRALTLRRDAAIPKEG